MLNFFYKSRFLDSRIAFWRKNARTFKDAQDLCVGSWNEQESYPYVQYLLERYSGVMGKAYDFGCGVGRMMRHMLYRFEHVDGGELVPENISYAKTYLDSTLGDGFKIPDYFNLMADLLWLAKQEHTISFIPQLLFIILHHSRFANKSTRIFSPCLSQEGLSVHSLSLVLIQGRIGLTIRTKKYFLQTRSMFQSLINLISKGFVNGLTAWF